MVLQIQYQPNAMMLGSMSQSAGEAAYSRWLTEFNQNKMKMNADAFATGFSSIGMPIAQMQSRERMHNSQIAARGQELAQKGMDDVKWWEENGARVQDMVSSNLISQHGPSVINDSMFADQVINAPKYMTREEGQKRLMDWSSNSETARSYKIANSPTALRARTSGLIADTAAATKDNPVFQQQMQSLQRRLNEGGLKPAAAQQMAKKIMARVQRRGDPSSRSPTIEERLNEYVHTSPASETSGPLGGKTTTVFKPDGSVQSVEYHNENLNLMKQYTLNANQIEDLTSPPSTYGGMQAEPLTGPQQKARLNVIRGLERQNRQIMVEIYGTAEDPTLDSIDAAQSYQEQTEVWSQQHGQSGGRAISNQFNLGMIKDSGILDESLRLFGVSEPADLPAEWWKKMGFSSPPPKKPDNRGVMQRGDEDAKRAAGHVRVLQELQGSQVPDNTPPLNEQLQGIEQNQQREAMAPKTDDQAKAIRSSIGKRYGTDITKWPPEVLQQFREATEFLRTSRFRNAPEPQRPLLMQYGP